MPFSNNDVQDWLHLPVSNRLVNEKLEALSK